LKRHLRPLLPLVRAGRCAAAVLRGAVGPKPGITGSVLDPVRGAGARWTLVEPPARVELPPTLTFGAAAPWKLAAETGYTTAEAGFWEIEETRFWGHYSGVAVDAAGRLVVPLSPSPWGPLSHPARLRWRWPEPERVRGVTAVLCAPEAEDNFWHWTSDLLPRLHLIEQAGWELSRIDCFLVNGTLTGFRAETLRAAGVSLDKVRAVDAGTDLLLERALFPSGRDVHFHLPPWAHDFLVRRFPRGVWSGGRRLYVSRQGCAFRRAIDPGPLEAELKRRGFVEFRPEAHPVGVQRAAFEDAEVVAGVHGSGFTHAMFCRPGASLLEVFSPLYVDPAFFVVSALAGVRHASVIGRGELPPEGVDPRARFADVDVDVAAVARALDGLGV
jgi:hypothetical protein